MPLLNLTFALGVNHNRKNETKLPPQWQAYSSDRKTMYVPHKDGMQPSEGHTAWVAEFGFIIYSDDAGKKIAVVKLKQEVQKPGTSPRALRRKGIDPEKFQAEQMAQQTVEQVVAKTGITAKNNVVQVSSRNMKKTARQAQATA